MPPLAVIVWLYGVPCVPLGSEEEDGEMTIAAGGLIVSVNVCVALGVTVLLAVNVMVELPVASPTLGLPFSVAVPLPLSTKFRPLGSVAPPSLIEAVGNPEVVMVKDPG